MTSDRTSPTITIGTTQRRHDFNGITAQIKLGLFAIGVVSPGELRSITYSHSHSDHSVHGSSDCQ